MSCRQILAGFAGRMMSSSSHMRSAIGGSGGCPKLTQVSCMLFKKTYKSSCTQTESHFLALDMSNLVPYPVLQRLLLCVVYLGL